MKNKIVFLGSLCLILALGLVFVGCQDEGVQVVEYDTLSSPDKVTASWVAAVAATATTPLVPAHLLVKWEANDSKASGYRVVLSQKDKDNYYELSGGAVIETKETTSYTSTTANASGYYPITITKTVPDIDQYEAKFEQNTNNNGISTYSGTFRVGVLAEPRNSTNRARSDVAWAKDEVTIPVYATTTMTAPPTP